ncbi:MAG: AMP-binding protein [Clostridia bacterium]|nr:AMP-binding protein [Clostridia bacterium]
MEYYEVKDFENFTQLIENSETEFNTGDAFIQKKNGEEVRLDYYGFKDSVMAAGAFLRSKGFEKTNVAVCANNCIEWCVSYMASAIYTNAVVPIDKELPGEEITNILNRSGAKALFCSDKVYKKICGDVSDDILIILFDGESDASSAVDFSSVIETQIESDTMPQKDKDALSVILFTSGTTGKSKAVALSQYNICSDINSIMRIVKINRGERIMSLLPLNHTYECTITFLCCLSKGVTICFCSSITRLYREINEYKPHELIVVPLILEAFYKKLKPYFKLPILPKKKILDAMGGNLKLLVCGAAPVNSEMLESFGKLGITAIQGYGLTECSPIAVCNSDSAPVYDSIGKPIPFAEVKLVDCDENGIGEFCIKGPMVMLGYIDDSGKINDMRDTDGYFHTGDLGTIDSDGFCRITGRLKNVIIAANGKNVFPEELEMQLTENKKIDEALVYEGKDSFGETAVCAKIVTDADRDTIAKIIKKINDKNVSYKAIKNFEICEDLPKNAAHKIIRHN